MMPGQGDDRGRLIAADALRERLRAEHPDRHIYRTPWGWAADKRGTDDVIQAPTLEELAEKLALEDR
jgi:hypothetical protein